jgi:hypothetical protein
VNFLLEITNTFELKINENSNFNNNNNTLITEESEDIEKILQLLEEVIININENGSFEYATNIFSEYFYKILLIILSKINTNNDNNKR